MQVKCLSVCQPWAWAIVAGLKRVENRTWRTHYRGPLLIHAGKSRKRMIDVLPDGTRVPDGLPFGAVVGVVDLVDCVRFEDVSDDPFAMAGYWCWRVENPRAIEAVAWKGQRNLFEVEEEFICEKIADVASQAVAIPGYPNSRRQEECSTMST